MIATSQTTHWILEYQAATAMFDCIRSLPSACWRDAPRHPGNRPQAFGSLAIRIPTQPRFFPRLIWKHHEPLKVPVVQGGDSSQITPLSLAPHPPITVQFGCPAAFIMWIRSLVRLLYQARASGRGGVRGRRWPAGTAPAFTSPPRSLKSQLELQYSGFTLSLRA